MQRKLIAEFLGTFWLVFCGCGSVVLATSVSGDGVGLLGVSLAFGLAVVTMAYAVGPVSGGHFNPAVSLGMWVAGRLGVRELGPYVAVQVAGAILAAGLLLVVANGSPNYDLGTDGLASNGWGDKSPGSYGLGAVLVVEVVLTFIFLVVILGVTDKRAPKALGPLAIGLALTATHLVSIPVSGSSVNPARSTGPALFVGTEALSQLWAFWLAPLVGAALAGLAYRYLLAGDEDGGDVDEGPEQQPVRQATGRGASATGDPKPGRGPGRQARRR